MHQSVLAGEDFHHGAEVQDAADLAGENIADLNFAGQPLDDGDGFLGGFHLGHPGSEAADIGSAGADGPGHLVQDKHTAFPGL
ncbi:MAG: hypothetical protein UU16_C0005G0024 [Candidatus Woesebacteria bacterium GW2011_GWA2_40_7]|uniref:Uncharacterized protein n=1 Tax=Candidatus Woesebacteria bacterium GW2011_GWA2_40_7 TaxID=1618562 RepID=A0A0G0WFZ0_9BACT|nr:MAG: hypothetical protein UU16_C0005G0024 [Candidatus Woesebacteria bacterium GW2011_GWA2_40_7]